MRIVSVGEILWDVIGETEYLGGAPLNFAAHARQLGHEVFLVSGVGDDERGRRALDGLRQRGISTEFVQVLPGKNTGTAEVELDADGKPMFRIVRPAAYDFVELTRSPAETPCRTSAGLDLLRHALPHVEAGAGLDFATAGDGALGQALLRCEPARRQLEPVDRRATGGAGQRDQVKRQRGRVSSMPRSTRMGRKARWSISASAGAISTAARSSA